MKKIVKKITLYQCPICKTKYSNASDAKKCEARILEEKKFKIGDPVTNIEPRQCWNRDKRQYKFKGTIVQILGPLLPGEEYENKWLGGNSERLNSHVWQYEVEYICPRCQEKEMHRYYAPEIKKLEIRKIR